MLRCPQSSHLCRREPLPPPCRILQDRVPPTTSSRDWTHPQAEANSAESRVMCLAEALGPRGPGLSLPKKCGTHATRVAPHLRVSSQLLAFRGFSSCCCSRDPACSSCEPAESRASRPAGWLACAGVARPTCHASHQQLLAIVWQHRLVKYTVVAERVEDAAAPRPWAPPLHARTQQLSGEERCPMLVPRVGISHCHPTRKPCLASFPTRDALRAWGAGVRSPKPGFNGLQSGQSMKPSIF